MNYIFLGPSGYGIDNKLLEGWTVLPPCKQSDLLQLIYTKNVNKICIVDGLYKSIPAPWHKEILLAIELGICLDGIGSLGALRACELDTCGMNGFGWVYSYIKENDPIDDSIVALLHNNSHEHFKPISIAKIEALYLFSLFSKYNEYSREFSSLSQEMMPLSFETLSIKKYSSLLYAYDSSVEWEDIFINNFTSIKQLDVINYLKSANKNLDKKDYHKKVAQTPYIYRQNVLDYEIFNYSDVSALSYSLQLFCCIKDPLYYDQIVLKAHIALSIRHINHILHLKTEKSYEYLDKELIQYLLDLQNSIYFVDNLGLSWVKGSAITIEFIENMSKILNIEYFDVLLDNDMSFYSNYFNIYSRLSLYNNISSISNSQLYSLLPFFKLLLKLNHIIDLISEKEIMISTVFQNEDKNQQILSLHENTLSICKTNAMQFFYGSWILQTNFLQSNRLSAEFYDFINKKPSYSPYRLYRDSYHLSDRNKSLKKLQSSNLERLLPVQPAFCLGTHFINFNHLLIFSEVVNDC